MTKFNGMAFCNGNQSGDADCEKTNENWLLRNIQQKVAVSTINNIWKQAALTLHWLCIESAQICIEFALDLHWLCIDLTTSWCSHKLCMSMQTHFWCSHELRIFVQNWCKHKKFWQTIVIAFEKPQWICNDWCRVDVVCKDQHGNWCRNWQNLQWSIQKSLHSKKLLESWWGVDGDNSQTSWIPWTAFSCRASPVLTLPPCPGRTLPRLWTKRIADFWFIRNDVERWKLD